MDDNSRLDCIDMNLASCEEKIKIQAKRIKELEEILIEYGKHSAGCSAQYNTTHNKYPCRCGWDREKKIIERITQITKDSIAINKI